MKRYLLFCFDDYYPGGGTNDLQGSYDSVLACVAAVDGQYANILDTHTGMVTDVPCYLNADELVKWAQSQHQSDWQEINNA
jgi:hypothetical protein